ncbi:MAG: transposase, partial [Armatimonadota bacterium]
MSAKKNLMSLFILWLNVMTKVYVGIDVSKEKLDVAIHPFGEFVKFENNLEGLEKLKERLSSLSIARIVIEHSGGYERLAFNFLSSSGFPCSLVNPKSVRDFAKATGRLEKTDKLDAFVLAQYGEAIKPAITPLPDKKREKVRELVERRGQLVKMKVAEENRLSKARGEVRESILSVLACIKESIKAI